MLSREVYLFWCDESLQFMLKTLYIVDRSSVSGKVVRIARI